MKLENIKFPIYRIRTYSELKTTLLGVVKVTTFKGTFILDDLSLPGSFNQRRIKLYSLYDKNEIYKLNEQFSYFRQLIKYPSNTTFIDDNGTIFKYKKSSKMFKIFSHRIRKIQHIDNWSIIYIDNMEIPFLIGYTVRGDIKYASIMETKWGPLLYDLTTETHEPFIRKL